jgi:DNA-binding MarR family transcriptional regulator
MMQMRLTCELAHQLVADSGLSYQDYMVLVALTDRPEGRMRLFEMARDLGWEKSRVSHHVARMAERGLVTKEKCGGDRRGAFVVITKRGRKEIEAAAPGHVDAVRRLFIDPLTPRQLDAVRAAAEAVVAALDEQREE